MSLRGFQHRVDFGSGQRFGQYLPLLRRIDFQSGIMGNYAVEQEIFVKMPQGRQLAGHRTIFHGMREQPTEKIADILPPGRRQFPAFRFEEFRELFQIGLVSAHRQGGQPLLDLEIIEKSSDDALIGGVHRFQYGGAMPECKWQAWYRFAAPGIMTGRARSSSG